MIRYANEADLRSLDSVITSLEAKGLKLADELTAINTQILTKTRMSN